MHEPLANLIPMEQCIRGRIYRVHCRNLAVAVYDGEGGFIGIRTKFGSRYLFTEFHWDKDPHLGTVKGMEDLGIDVPENIPVLDDLGTVDKKTQRPVAFHPDRKWFFTDTDQNDPSIEAYRKSNTALFKLLDTIEKEQDEK